MEHNGHETYFHCEISVYFFCCVFFLFDKIINANNKTLCMFIKIMQCTIMRGATKLKRLNLNINN